MPPRCSAPHTPWKSTAATFGAIGLRDLCADWRGTTGPALAGATVVELTRVQRVLADAVGRLGPVGDLRLRGGVQAVSKIVPSGVSEAPLTNGTRRPNQTEGALR